MTSTALQGYQGKSSFDISGKTMAILGFSFFFLFEVQSIESSILPDVNEFFLISVVTKSRNVCAVTSSSSASASVVVGLL
jgi:hypothetical protein